MGTLAQAGAENGIKLTALVYVGGVLGEAYDRSMLYHPGFSTLFREASAPSVEAEGDATA